MTERTHVQLTKVTILNVEGTLFEEGYWSRGQLMHDIEVGQPITMARYTRAPQSPGESPDGVDCPGAFCSSPVESIVGDLVYTRNSVWRVTPITLVAE